MRCVKLADRREFGDEVDIAFGFRVDVCPWPVFSPRFWPREVPTPRGEFSVSASLGFPPPRASFIRNDSPSVTTSTL